VRGVVPLRGHGFPTMPSAPTLSGHAVNDLLTVSVLC
jgi:hypothetical protein